MLVYDKNIFGSNRSKDANGYLRCEDCNITRVQVAGYLGKEIPNYREFELEPDKIYYVLRPEAELKKAVETFNNLPLTRKHIEIDVDNVPKEDIVGSLGDSARVEDGFLKNSLIVYDQKYIDRIENGKQKELSCGYRYTPVRQSGEFEGQHYDFVMTDIVGNHVALVKEGRAGHDVVVADSKPDFEEKENTMTDITKDEFVESEHPRAKNGQFTSKGGEGSSRSESEIAKGKMKGYISSLEHQLENKYYSDEEDKKRMESDLESAKKAYEEKYGSERKTHFLEEGLTESSKESPIINYKGSKIFIDKDGKYANVLVVPPDGKTFNNGDTFYTTEAEADKAEELAKKIIDTEFGGSESKEESSKEDVSPKIKNHLKEKIAGWYKTAKEDYGVSGKFIDAEEKINKSGGKDLVIRFEEDGKEQKTTIGWYKDYTPEQIYDIWMEFGADEELANDSKLSKEQRKKVGIVMKEFKDGELKSSSGKTVTNPAQAKAIALSEAKQAKDTENPDEQDKPETAGEVKADKKDSEMDKEEKKESVAEVKEEDIVKDKSIDKRKLIDEIGGILKGKVDDELIRTIIGKAEQIAYNGSEAGEADDAEIKTKKEKEDFAEGVVYGEKKEKEEPKKLDSEHESEGMKKYEEKKAEDKCGKMAKDEAMAFDIDTIKTQVRQEMIADFKARDEARKSVKGTLGDINVMAFDSCEDIYKMACEKAGLNVTDIANYKDAFVGYSFANKASKGKLALDASPTSGSNVEECLKKNIRI